MAIRVQPESPKKKNKERKKGKEMKKTNRQENKRFYWNCELVYPRSIRITKSNLQQGAKKGKMNRACST